MSVSEKNQDHVNEEIAKMIHEGGLGVASHYDYENPKKEKIEPEK
ncbi:hypothetical protein [Oceanobacillus salinisoli]|nr:hypothetical protein [Oceanobacillus salinisoli]